MAQYLIYSTTILTIHQDPIDDGNRIQSWTFKESLDWEVCWREWKPSRHLFNNNRWILNRRRALDTVRTLVEHGSADPTEMDQSQFTQRSAVTLCYVQEVLEYLLQQVDVYQFHDFILSFVSQNRDMGVLRRITAISRLTELALLSQKPGSLQRTLSCLIHCLRSYYYSRS